MKTLIIIIIISMASCSHMTGKQKALMSCVVATQGGDYATTKHNLEDGGKEKNSLYGENPGPEALLFGKIITVGAFYGLGRVFPEHQTLIYGIGCGIGTGAILWNMSQ